jgi:hypothetical protein
MRNVYPEMALVGNRADTIASAAGCRNASAWGYAAAAGRFMAASAVRMRMRAENRVRSTC